MIDETIRQNLLLKFDARGQVENFFDYKPRLIKLDFEDGTFLKFKYSFCRTSGKYLVVFTEHNGYHAFYASSLRPKSLEAALLEK